MNSFGLSLSAPQWLSSRHIVLIFLLCMLGPLHAGCGQSDRLSISGSVAWKQGDPLQQGSIIFEPESGEDAPQVAAQVVDGEFRLNRSIGPMPGTYRVRIHAKTEQAGLDDPRQFSESGMSLVPQEQIDAKYNTASETIVEISTSSTTFEFEVEPRRDNR